MSDTTFIPLIVARKRKEAMIEDDKKLLAEFLGECWHEETRVQYCDGSNGGRCKIIVQENRDFTTWQDLGDLKDKLVEKRKFEKFYVYAVKNWTYEPRSSDFTQWIINPAVFIPLVVEFLRKESA